MTRKKKCPPHHWAVATDTEQREDGSRFFPAECKNCPETHEFPLLLREDWNLGTRSEPERFKDRPNRSLLADEVVA